MKSFILIAGFLIGIAGAAYSATQAQSLGVVDVTLKSMTLAEIQTSTASAAGKPVYCSNCVGGGGQGTICISTGSTVAYQYVLSTGTACK